MVQGQRTFLIRFLAMNPPIFPSPMKPTLALRVDEVDMNLAKASLADLPFWALKIIRRAIFTTDVGDRDQETPLKLLDNRLGRPRIFAVDRCR